MVPLDAAASPALREALATQPLTPAKVGFVWALAAGPTVARATRITFDSGVLTVHAKSGSWRDEIYRARPLILSRIDRLLGSDVVREFVVSAPETKRRA
jgi:hypothetical protein